MSGRRGGLCRAWRACSHSWSQAAAGTEDRGQGRGDSPESTCPSRGFGEPSGKWTPGTPRCSATGWSTRSPHQACGGNRLVPPSPSSDRGSTQTRLRTRRYAASSEPTPHNHDHPRVAVSDSGGSTAQAAQLGWAGPLITPRSVCGLMSPPRAQPACLLRCSGSRAPGRVLERTGRWGNQRAGRCFHAQPWSVGSEQSDALPAGSTSPQRPLPSATEGSCLDFPGEDAPSTDRGQTEGSTRTRGLV